MADAAELVDTAAAAVRHLEERGLVAEDVAPAVGLGPVEPVAGVVDEALAGDVRHVGACDRDDLAGGVCRIVHGRAAGHLAPALAATPPEYVVEAVIPIVIVFCLAVDDGTKVARLVAPAAVED